MKSLQLSKPHLLVVIGVPGSGKSTFATTFAKTFTAPFVDYVQLRQLTGGDSLARQVTDYVLDQLLRTKQTIVIDGHGDSLDERRKIVNLALKNGYAPLFIWVQTEPATAEYRAVHAKTATMTKKEFDARMSVFENPTRVEPVHVISGKHTYPSQARTVLKKLITERPLVDEVKVKTPPTRQFQTRGRII